MTISEKTQETINSMYGQLAQLVQVNSAKAQTTHKPLLLIVGEIHQPKLPQFSLLFRNTFLVHRLLMEIVKDFAINTLYLESDPLHAKKRHDDCRDNALIRQNNRCALDSQANENGFNTIFLEKGDKPHFYTASKQTPTLLTEREAEWVQILTTTNQAGIVNVGYLHLGGLTVNARLKAKFTLCFINTAPTLIMEMKPAYPDSYRLQFGSQPENAFQVQLLEFNEAYRQEDLITSVHTARDNYASVQATTSYPSQALSRFYSFASEVLTRSQQYFFKEKHPSTTVSAWLSERLLTSTPLEQPIVSIGSPSPQNNDPSEPPDHNTERTPIQPLLTVGFWALAKSGYCARVRPNIFIHYDQHTQAVVDQQLKQTSAEKRLNQLGTSLEKVSHYCFGGNDYSHSPEEQAALKFFLIDLVNGDISNSLAKEFNHGMELSDEATRHEILLRLKNTFHAETPSYYPRVG